MTAVMIGKPGFAYTKSEPMDRYVLFFVRAALLYLLAGVGLGLAMGIAPADSNFLYYLLPSHTHLNLLGFVCMLIFGLAYHILPRFTGRLLYSPKLAWLHFFLANIGVLGMSVFFFLNRYQEGQWRGPLAASMVAQAAGIVLFVYNIWISTIPLKRG